MLHILPLVINVNSRSQVGGPNAIVSRGRKDAFNNLGRKRPCDLLAVCTINVILRTNIMLVKSNLIFDYSFFFFWCYVCRITFLPA